SDISEIVYVTALAVHGAIRPHIAINKAVTLKWPNDTLIDGAKVSGVLIEATGVRRDHDRLTADVLVVGIGINVVSHPVDGIIYPATSLRKEGSAVDRDHLLIDLTASFLGALDLWADQGFKHIRDLYLERADSLNGQITARISSRPHDQV